MSDRRQDLDERKQQGILKQVKELLDSQKSMNEKQLKDLRQTIKEGTQKEVDRQLLVNTLKEMKGVLHEDKDKKQIEKLNKNIVNLNKITDTKLAPDKYVNPMSDLVDGLMVVNKNMNSNIVGMKDAVIGSVSQGIGRMTSVFSSAFSPLMPMKDLVMGLYDTVKGFVSSFIIPIYRYFVDRRRRSRIERQVQMVQFSQTDSLRNISSNIGSMHDIQKDQLKIDEARWRRERRTSESGDKGQRLWPYLLPWVKILKGAGTALAVVLSPLIIQFGIFETVFINPFVNFVKWLGKTRFARYIGSFIDRMGWFGNVLRTAGRGIGTVASNFLRITDFLHRIGSTLFRLSRVIPVIGWAITGIIGVVDFFRGFMAAEGNFLDRIKAGLTEAVAGLVRLPVSLLGWIADWVLGWFKIEIDGGAGAAMMKSIKKVINFALSAILFPFQVIYKSISLLISGITKIGDFTGIFGLIKNAISTTINIILFPFRTIWNILKIFKNIFQGDFKGAGDNIKNIFGNIKDLMIGVFKWVTWPFQVFIINPIQSLISFFSGNREIGVFSVVKSVIRSLFSAITWPFRTFIVRPIESLINFFSGDREIGVFSAVKSIVGNLFNAITWPFRTFIIKPIESLINFFSDDKEIGVFSAIKSIVQSLFNAITWPFRTFIIKPIESLIGWFTGSPNPSIFQNAMETLKNVVQLLFNAVSWPFRTFIVRPIESLINFFSGDREIGVFSAVKSIFSSLFGAITWPFRTFIIKPIESMIGWFTGKDVDILNTILSGIKTAVSNVWNVISWPFMTVYNLFSLFTIDDGSGILSGILTNIKTAISNVFNVISWPFRTFIIKPMESLIGWVSNIFSGDIGFIDTTKSILGSVFDIPNKITGWLRDTIPSWGDIKEMIPSIGSIGDRVRGWFSRDDSDEKEEKPPSGKTRSSHRTTGLLGSYEKGGIIPKTGPYELHKGEEVIPTNNINSFGILKGIKFYNIKIKDILVRINNNLSKYLLAPKINKEDDEKKNNIVRSNIYVKETKIIEKEPIGKIDRQNIIVKTPIYTNKENDKENKWEKNMELLTKEIKHLHNIINNLNIQQPQTQDRNALRAIQMDVEPPDEIESLGLLLYNKSWGMG